MQFRRRGTMICPRIFLSLSRISKRPHHETNFPTDGSGLLASCASQRRVVYLQDIQPGDRIPVAESYQIRIKPLDRLTVVVNSRNPELAAPFNTSSSYTSLNGSQASSSAAGVNALQVRTVDTEGMLDMPIIGPVPCAGKTREELARDIARKDRSRRLHQRSRPSTSSSPT